VCCLHSCALRAAASRALASRSASLGEHQPWRLRVHQLLGVSLCMARLFPTSAERSHPHSQGIHRGLGVHISKVRSCALDKWTPELVAGMEAVGNARANEFWERSVPASVERPREGDMRQLDVWIRDKYERGLYKDKSRPAPEGRLSATAATAAIPPPLPRKPLPAVPASPAVSATPAPAPRPASFDLLGNLLDAPPPPAPAVAAASWDAFAAPQPPVARPAEDWAASFGGSAQPAAAVKSTAAIVDLFGAAPSPAQGDYQGGYQGGYQSSGVRREGQGVTGLLAGLQLFPPPPPPSRPLGKPASFGPGASLL